MLPQNVRGPTYYVEEANLPLNFKTLIYGLEEKFAALANLAKMVLGQLDTNNLPCKCKPLIELYCHHSALDAHD